MYQDTHLVGNAFNGLGACGVAWTGKRTMRSYDITCPDCYAIWKEQDIQRILWEQQCSRAAAEYVQKKRLEFEALHKPRPIPSRDLSPEELLLWAIFGGPHPDGVQEKL